jgi:Uma2 family endonuclease
VTPSPLAGHQSVAGDLFVVLSAAKTPETKVMIAPLDWHLPDGGSVQPDILVIRREDYAPKTRLPASVIPLLVVEVLSPSNASYDRTLKRALYESLGVPAYWLVDPSEPSILALRLTDAAYQTEAEVSTGTFATTWPFPVCIALDELLQ